MTLKDILLARLNTKEQTRSKELEKILCTLQQSIIEKVNTADTLNIQVNISSENEDVLPSLEKWLDSEELKIIKRLNLWGYSEMQLIIGPK